MDMPVLVRDSESSADEHPGEGHPGGPTGHYPVGHPGQYPGALPGAFPGALPGALPGAHPGGKKHTYCYLS